MASTLKTPSVLAFERVLDISDAFLSQCNSQQKDSPRSKVLIREKSVRGTISNRLKDVIANNPTKLDAEIEKPNLQQVDSCSLDEQNDTLIAYFTCKVLPFSGSPNVCNNPAYQQAVQQVVTEYKEIQGVTELAKRYATNIANARWLWRNRVGAKAISVTVRNADQSITFNNAREISLRDFDDSTPELTQLTQWIEQGLLGQNFTLLEIEAQANIGYAQEVYPSQELVLDDNVKKSKILYRVGTKENNYAGIHSQKISNAIRTIDTWYDDYIEQGFPIAAEPYGSVTTLGTAFRQPKQKQDFYTLFDDWVLKGKTPTEEQQHYVMSVLIRGGVFGDSGKQ